MPKATCIDVRRDYYRVLGVAAHASGHEIRRAYRRLARQHHPDLSDQTGAADRFNAVSEAYQVLRDPDQRARYDHHHLATGVVDSQHDRAGRPPDPGCPVDGGFFGARGLAFDPGWRSAVVSGRDVEAILELSPCEAALAAAFAVTLTDAHGTAIELPAGTRPGQRIRIPGAGGRARPARPPGDLLLTVQVPLKTRV